MNEKNLQKRAEDLEDEVYELQADQANKNGYIDELKQKIGFI